MTYPYQKLGCNGRFGVGMMELQYLEVLDRLVHLTEIETRRTDRTGVGTFGIFGHQMRCDLGAEFPLLTTKKIHVPSVVTELQWFLQGRTDAAYLQHRRCTIWDEWATAEQCARFERQAGDLGPVYGKQWRNFGGEERADGQYTDGFDQIAWLVHEIRTNPHSRRLIVSGWDPRDAAVVALPPCHTMFQCRVADGRLSLHNTMRSCDVLLGLPFNLASYAFLVHALAEATDLRPGDLVFSFGDLHLYANHIDQARTQLAREPRRSPRVHVRPASPDDAAGVPYGLAFLTSEWAYDVVHYDPHPAIKAPVAV